VESIAGGLFAALIIDKSLPDLPEESMTGQLLRRLTASTDRRFQPINANFGLLPMLENAPRDKRLKRQLLAERGVAALEAVVGNSLLLN
jgi:methylenetetrahydrofolate--tRNA-(uracil-5-)-methyltransferase